MNVTALARRAGTTSETVRHYTDVGLLRPERNPDNGYRVYRKRDLDTLRFALSARALGFTLADIRELVEEAESGQSPCQHTRELIEYRLAEVERQIHALQARKARMREAMQAWAEQPDCQPGDGSHICGLIETFAREEVPNE
ncbi:MAG: MerR family DNA-binding protein [Alcanivoracaceae bacterium]|jgi:DNA-binding transcriptional MerR regulator|nr:MerR family DNA-binding protein [Alcanivoracaceae bacterium]